jgi:hypothetical protein
MIPNGFPPKTCGNDKLEQAVKIVIRGLDPGIQSLFNINSKDTKLKTFRASPLSRARLLPWGLL